MAQKLHLNSSSAISASLRPAFSPSLCKNIYQFQPIRKIPSPYYPELNQRPNSLKLSSCGKLSVKCSEKPISKVYKTCKICKTQYDAAQNHPRACRYHTAHFGGETKRKFESVYSGGTMNTPNSGQVLEYWHCCGSEDPFDPGCTSAPHSSYDD